MKGLVLQPITEGILNVKCVAGVDIEPRFVSNRAVLPSTHAGRFKHPLHKFASFFAFSAAGRFPATC